MRSVYAVLALALTSGALAQQIEYVPGLRGPDGRPRYGLTVPGPFGPRTFVDPYRCQEVPKGCWHVIEHELGHARDLMRYGATSEASANRQADWVLGFGAGGGGYWPPLPQGGWAAGGYWPPPPQGGWGASGYWPPPPQAGWGAGGYWPPPPQRGWAGGGYWLPPP